MEPRGERLRSGRRSERPAVSQIGRICKAPGCHTILSRYNPSPRCAQHQAPSPRPGPGV